MSSSFGIIVGRERDELPGYGVKNYAETEPDLTDVVNDQITENQKDTVNFYNEMAEIQKLIAETPLQNLESLAQFSVSARSAIKTFQDRQEAQEKINQAMDFLDKNSTAQLYNAEGKLDLENAKFDNELLNENTDASIDFLRARNIEVPEDISIKQLLRQLNTSYYGARLQFINENGGQDILDSETFINLHNAADELMVTAMLRKARELGIDTNSRQFRKAFYTTIYPDIKQRRENNIQSWKGNANRNFKEINKRNTRDIIVKTLEPYSANATEPINIDVMTLVETVKNKIPEIKNNREAIEYIFAEVAAVTAEDSRRLNLEHLDYLFYEAEFTHSATGVKSTLEKGDYNFKEGLLNIISEAQIDRASDVDNRNRADQILGEQEYRALLDQYPNGIPPQIERNFLRDTKNKYPAFDFSKVNANNARLTSSGGEYPDAGKPDGNLNYKQQLEDALLGTGPDKLEKSNEYKFQIDKAYGDFNRKVANQTAVGVELAVAQRNAYDTVERNLLAGKYTLNAVESRKGRAIEPSDILADAELLQADTNKARFNNNFNSITEKKALEQYKAHRLYGDVPFPNYFKGVVAGTKIAAEDYAEDRFVSTKGYDSTGNIAQRFTPNEDGILIDTQYGLSKKELNKFNVKPHLTKTNINMLQNPEVADKILNGFRKKGNELGTYQPNIGFGKKNGDKLTFAQVIEKAKNGDSNWGIFGFSSEEILEGAKSGVIDRDALFDEDIQSQIVFELIRQRSNRTNSIRGAIVQAKSGGEQTVFEGDEDIKRWDRLVNMKSEEVRATLDTFPMLRDMPMNQFQNLTAGVILEIEDIIKKEEAQDDAVSRVIKIDRQLFYYRDLLGKATEGDTGILGLRGLSKLSTRFVISQETIKNNIKQLEENRKKLEEANPNLELMLRKYLRENPKVNYRE